MASKITLELSPSDVERLINKLTIRDKIKLIRKLENQTWARRLDDVTSRIKSRIKRSRLSARDIRSICEDARQKIYNDKTKGSA